MIIIIQIITDDTRVDHVLQHAKNSLVFRMQQNLSKPVLVSHNSLALSLLKWSS